MRAMLKKIEIKNFKSLKDCSIELRDFNVVIGQNASGIGISEIGPFLQYWVMWFLPQKPI